VPELREENIHSNAAMSNWDEVTLGELASHMSGISRDYGLNDFSVNEYEVMTGYPRLHSLLPPLASVDRPVCGYIDRYGTYVTCNQSTFVSGIANAAAVFPTSYTTTYCNDGYVLLALALERIEKNSFENMFVQSLLEPLALEHSSYSVPSAAMNSYGVIPGNSTACGWENEFGPFSPWVLNPFTLNSLCVILTLCYQCRWQLHEFKRYFDTRQVDTK
jgi:CubicO group peptidase (beta-lactamase class C family)